jgi:hypothetical protein
MTAYFDGRERGFSEAEVEHVRKLIARDMADAKAYFTGQDVEIINGVGGKGAIRSVEFSDKAAYPRVPTESLAREMYLNGELTESAFDQTLEVAYNVNGINWGDMTITEVAP